MTTAAGNQELKRKPRPNPGSSGFKKRNPKTSPTRAGFLRAASLLFHTVVPVKLSKHLLCLMIHILQYYSRCLWQSAHCNFVSPCKPRFPQPPCICLCSWSSKTSRSPDTRGRIQDQVALLLFMSKAVCLKTFLYLKRLVCSDLGTTKLKKMKKKYLWRPKAELERDGGCQFGSFRRRWLEQLLLSAAVWWGRRALMEAETKINRFQV